VTAAGDEVSAAARRLAGGVGERPREKTARSAGDAIAAAEPRSDEVVTQGEVASRSEE